MSKRLISGGLRNDESEPLPMTTENIRPLEGLLVLDFSQFLAGPVAAMRLADLVSADARDGRLGPEGGMT